MKFKQMMRSATVTAALALGAASISASPSLSFPSIPLSISGTLYYTTNNNIKLNAPIVPVSFNTQSLIHLLNVSPSATNVLKQATGTNHIPVGSYFLWNPWNETLTITNRNGFSFPLRGSNYNLGYLDLGDSQLIGTYSLNAKTGTATETDRAGSYFYFSDSVNGEVNEFQIYGTALLNWTYGAASNGVCKATLSVTMTGAGNDGCYVNGYDAIATTFSATGSGSGSADSDLVPMYWNW
jgi:hypothetical protein